MRTNNEITSVIVAAVPLSQQIQFLDVPGLGNCVQFAWRGQRFRVNSSLCVEEVRGIMLHGSNTALLLQALLHRASSEIECRRIAAESKKG